MKLKNIFNKPVDRPIEGVIKADDEASLRLEVEEYVLTNEIEKRLEKFLDAYNNYEGANGVWVSGFFGSGKSHLLKMLALLLENREIEGIRTLEAFLSKCEDNEVLVGDLKRAASIPSQSILFNIDQKADVISKTEIDALLAVFIKVFDEACGYYGKHAYIAQFERELDKDGLLGKFKDEFKSVSGKEWEWARVRSMRMASYIDEAFNRVTGQSQENVLDKQRSDYRLSIEDFAANVNDYIEKKMADEGLKEFRLNFFVDEVGQYIADNVKLMTNLQTIAESLATKCKGKAWIIVTAQEEMKDVVGEKGKFQSNDFSKIQARFNNRMKLSSTDVAEVIQKRLLTKTEDGVARLSDLYHEQSNNFKTLFDFADGSISYRNFKDRDHFIRSYPFIPYQFELFQSAIRNLSEHNAFEGKHSSVGERSMLGVFQQVAIHISEHETGQLATFDQMFEGIRTALKAGVQHAVHRSERQLDNPFAIRVLKVLFLVKYVKEFQPTVRNICILMLDGFNKDMEEHKKQVVEALNLLEQQTYIQRNGEKYEYLTDEERDIEQEIKNTEVDSADVANELEKIIFEHVIKQRKIRYDETGQDYPFSRKLDDRLYGREYELSIHVISPFHEHCADEQMIITTSTYNADELFVMLPANERLMRDLILYKQTDKYVSQNYSRTQQENVKRILSDKGLQNRDRYTEIQKKIMDLLGGSKLFVGGKEFEISSQEAQTRIVAGFYELVKQVYKNLPMLRGVKYKESDIETTLKQEQGGLITSVDEAEQEIQAFVQSNERSGVRTTLKGVLEKFECKPYGWDYPAILCLLAKLYAHGKIEVRRDSNILEGSELVKALQNTHTQGNVIIQPQAEFTQAQIRRLKDFYVEFFDEPPHASEAKALGTETIEALKAKLEELSSLSEKQSTYPFLSALTPVIERIEEIKGKPYTWFLTDLPKHKDKLLDMKEDTLDPILRFMGGPQKDIFKEAQRFLERHKSNFDYLEGDDHERMGEILSDPRCFKGNSMQTLKELHASVEKSIKEQIDKSRTEAVEKLRTMQTRMQNMPEYQKLPDLRQADLDKKYDELIDNINQEEVIGVINDRLRHFEEKGYQVLLDRMTEMAAPKPVETYDKQKPESEDTPKVSEPKIEYVHSRQVAVDYDKAWLEDEKDLEEYLESMREALLEEIHKGKRVRI